MIHLITTPALAAEHATAAQSFSFLIPMIAIFAVVYFLIIRPQNQRLKQHRDMVSALKRGDVVVTAGGVIGKVQRVQEEECLVEIADGVRIRVLKGTISDVRQS